jgi:hypothetical protein
MGLTAMTTKPAPHLDLDWVLSAPTADGKGYICGWVFENKEDPVLGAGWP